MSGQSLVQRNSPGRTSLIEGHHWIFHLPSRAGLRDYVRSNSVSGCPHWNENTDGDDYNREDGLKHPTAIVQKGSHAPMDMQQPTSIHKDRKSSTYSDGISDPVVAVNIREGDGSNIDSWFGAVMIHQWQLLQLMNHFVPMEIPPNEQPTPGEQGQPKDVGDHSGMGSSHHLLDGWI